MVYLKEDSLADIDLIDEYNQEYLKFYPDFKPFVTKENFYEFIKEVENKKQGINNNGVKEIYYWLIEDNKIIGSGSIRLNPEVDENTMLYSGHIMYQIIPSKRGQGYGNLICHLLLEKMKEMGYEHAIITCMDDNITSSKIIEHNGGVFIEKVKEDNTDNYINRYQVKIK